LPWAAESRTFGAYLNAIAPSGLHIFLAPYPARCAGLLNFAPTVLLIGLDAYLNAIAL